MTKDFVLDFQGDYFHIKNNGNNKITLENMKKLWKTLAEECRTHNCHRVLSEGEIFSNEKSLSEVYQLASSAAEAIPLLRIAFFIEGYVPNDLIKFFELVASNRDITVKFFPNRNEAIHWLGIDSAKHFPDV